MALGPALLDADLLLFLFKLFFKKVLFWPFKEIDNNFKNWEFFITFKITTKG